MRLIITRAQAIREARSYADEHDVPWVGINRVRTFREWWPFTPQSYLLDIDTGGQSTALATIRVPLWGVERFEFRASDASRFWLPPWAAFPRYSAVTIGWRQGSGEVYLTDWFAWYASLPEERREAYRLRFPAPDRDGWRWFYEPSRGRM